MRRMAHQGGILSVSPNKYPHDWGYSRGCREAPRTRELLRCYARVFQGLVWGVRGACCTVGVLSLSLTKYPSTGGTVGDCREAPKNQKGVGVSREGG
jgi:hypothetical protein